MALVQQECIRLTAPNRVMNRCAPFVSRHRYRQDPLPLGTESPPAELFEPEQPYPPGLKVAKQGQQEVDGALPMRSTHCRVGTSCLP